MINVDNEKAPIKLKIKRLNVSLIFIEKVNLQIENIKNNWYIVNTIKETFSGVKNGNINLTNLYSEKLVK